MAKKHDVLRIVAEVVSEVTGLDPVDVTYDASLEDDLGLDMMESFPRIMRGINEQLDGALPLSDKLFVADIKACETIAELVDLIESESEF